jgi:NitT/TauT family transport system permease protein
MLNTFNQVETSKIMLLKSMGANKFQILFKLILPNALTEFISLLKINIGLTWVGTIMGEYLVSRAGLGYLIIYGSQIFNLDLVMASTIILCILAGLMYYIVAYIEKLVYKKFNN